ncbi:MAG: penicillin-binding protein activator [Thiotrichales bacterium]|nr:penicillin-binding protein activator [Thiotrichales bacterium]
MPNFYSVPMIGLLLALSYTPASFAFSLGELFGFGEEKPTRPAAPTSTDSAEASLKQIDQEILILRAELAVKNGDQNGLRQHLQQLEKSGVLPQYQARYEQLRQRLGPTSTATEAGEKGALPKLLEFFNFGGSMQTFQINLTDPNTVIALVLPQSGSYRNVGAELVQGIEESLKRLGFRGRILKFDTQAESSVYAIWQRLQTYQPNLVIGPLRKKQIEDWHQMQTGVPTLFLNDAPMPFAGNERSLSPSRSGGLVRLINRLESQNHRQMLVLAHLDEKTQPLSNVLQRYNQQSQGVQFDVQSVSKGVDQALEQGLGLHQSAGRAAVLQKHLGRKLEFAARARQDLDGVISLLPAQEAVQITPYLQLYQRENLTHIWYSPQAPKLSDLTLHRVDWQNTEAFLPDYLFHAYQQTTNLRPETENGIFYALGTAAVEILPYAEKWNQQTWLIQTQVGQVQTQPAGAFVLLPSVYRLDSGKVQPLTTP